MSGSVEISVSWAQALAWRLGRQLLDPVGQAPVAEVVRRLGAVPATEESSAELAVRVRRHTSGPGELARALAEGRVVKVFAFRGGMNYLSPEDGGAYLAVRAAGRQWELPSWQEYYRLTPSDWPAFGESVREALRDGPLTIAELGAVLTRRPAYRHLKAVFDDDAWTLMKPLTWQGYMGFGPRRGREHTFQPLDDNPRWKGIPELDDAGRHAVMAYLRSYGPASTDRVHYWLGDGLSAGRKRIDRWLRDIDDELVAVDVEGTTAYVVRSDAEELVTASPSKVVRLLPGHDQWVMGPGTKDGHVTPPSLRDPVTRRASLVIVGGVVSGTWSIRNGELAVTWLADGRTPRAALEQETTRLSAILGRPLELRVED
jgi:hypothetical protein